LRAMHKNLAKQGQSRNTSVCINGVALETRLLESLD